jgi:hypothetical protein
MGHLEPLLLLLVDTRDIPSEEYVMRKIIGMVNVAVASSLRATINLKRIATRSVLEF